ncbi:MAG: multi-sensor hybrid histidine kinase [Bryobacterales bacterium]|nr:multi-sensor hybrid histidine kinase [Bryobacterales bacterium]
MQTSPERKTVLVVDDNFSVLTVIKAMLETDDYDVLTARSADVTISIAQMKGVIDLVLMDVVMPDVSGPDLVEKILAIHPTAKVLFMSGYCETDMLPESVRMAGLLPKPFTSSRLRERIDQALGTGRRASSAVSSARF